MVWRSQLTADTPGGHQCTFSETLAGVAAQSNPVGSIRMHAVLAVGGRGNVGRSAATS